MEIAGGFLRPSPQLITVGLQRRRVGVIRTYSTLPYVHLPSVVCLVNITRARRVLTEMVGGRLTRGSKCKREQRKPCR